jgi:uncharacterized membrane protein YqjE
VSSRTVVNGNDRTLASVIAEAKGELKEFIQTRLEMLQVELKEKTSALKSSLPMMAAALLLLGTAWFLWTATLVAVIAAAFYPSRWAYFFGFLIVALVYTLMGAVAGALGYQHLKKTKMMPERTIKVLREDRLWLQTEARTQV